MDHPFDIYEPFILNCSVRIVEASWEQIRQKLLFTDQAMFISTAKLSNYLGKE